MPLSEFIRDVKKQALVYYRKQFCEPNREKNEKKKKVTGSDEKAPAPRQLQLRLSFVEII